MKLFGIRLFGKSGGSKVFEFRCSECGKMHRGSPSFGYAKPPHYFDVPEAERAERTEITADTCIIDNDTFFIRVVLELPIHGVDEPFTWGVWVSQSRESFERYAETFGQDQSGHGSFGWLAVTMPGYADPDPDAEPENLACDVKWREAGTRPLIVPHECDHPLYRDYVDGMPWERAIELAQRVMHGLET